MQQQMSVAPQVMAQMAQLQQPEHLAYAQQNVQNCFSPATASSSFLPEQQQVQIPAQPFPLELVRGTSSGSDGSSQEDSPYLMNLPGVHGVVQPAVPAGFTQVPQHAPMPGFVPAHACGYAPQAQQVLAPLNFAPQQMQVQQPAMQHFDAQPAVPSPVPRDDEDASDLQKCGQTEVSIEIVGVVFVCMCVCVFRRHHRRPTVPEGEGARNVDYQLNTPGTP